MTWSEEWFLYFQWKWGRESTTLTLLKDSFKMPKSTIRRILRHKLNAVLEARKRWPRFATLEKDVTLMSAWWLNKYGEKRVIMWDDTNINIPAASDAHLNRQTYSTYYAGNFAKGACSFAAVAVAPHPGAELASCTYGLLESDTEYQNHTTRRLAF